MNTISVSVNSGSGTIDVRPEAAAKALSDAGWTVYPPVIAEEALFLMDGSVPIAEGWRTGHWRDADQPHMLVPEPIGDRVWGRHRTGDHATSVAGAHAVAFRAGSQSHRLLAGYEAAGNTKHIGGDDYGFTDEEAAEWAGLLRSCYWKRCGELRQDGLIEVIPQPSPDGVLTRIGSAGSPRIVCRITDEGRARLARLSASLPPM